MPSVERLKMIIEFDLETFFMYILYIEIIFSPGTIWDEV